MSLIRPHKRGFLKGLGLLIAAPAIVRVSSIMPVRSHLDLNGRSTYVTYGNEAFAKGDDWTIEFLFVKGGDQHGNWRAEKIAIWDAANPGQFVYVDSIEATKVRR